MTLNEDQFRMQDRTARLGEPSVGFHAADGAQQITVSDRGVKWNGYSWDSQEFPRGVINYTPPTETVTNKATGRYNKREDIHYPVVDPSDGEVIDPGYARNGAPSPERGMQQTWLEPHPGGLDDFYVHPAHQGKGYGGDLLNAAQEVHQQRFGRNSVIGADPSTSVSEDTVNVVNHYGASSHIEENDPWTAGKHSRDSDAERAVRKRGERITAHQGDTEDALGPKIDIRTSLQDKLRVAGMAPEAPAPAPEGKQLSMLSKKKSNAPKIKKRLQQ